MIEEVETDSGERLQIGADGVVQAEASSFVEVEVHQVKECLQWLGRAEPSPDSEVSSFWLKHIVQDWAGTEISNGAVIVAAHRLGFRIRRDPGETSSNVSIGIARHCVDEFDCGCGHP